MADVTKVLKFLITGDTNSASKAFKGLSADMQAASKSHGFKGLGTDLMQAVKSGQGFKGVGGVLKSAASEAGGLKGVVGKVGIGLAAAGAAGIAAGAAIAVKFGADSVAAFKNVAGEVLKVKRLTGETAEDASRLNFAFKQTGVDSGAGAKAIGIFSKNLAKMGDQDDAAKARAEAQSSAIKGQIAALEKAGPSTAGYADKLAGLKARLSAVELSGKTSSSTLAKMGIDYRDANGNLKPMADLLPSIAEKFKNMPDGANKTALAMKLFGKSGADLLPFLNKGADGLKDLAAKSDAFGNTLNDKQLQALKDSKQAQRDWDAAMQGLQVTLGANLLPLLTTFATGVNSALIPAIQGATGWIQKNQGAFDAMGNMMRWVWNNLLLPVVKAAIIGFVQMNKPLAIGIELLGKLTGNSDMEKFGAGMLSMADDAIAFANGLKGIPKQVKPTISADTTAGQKNIATLDKKIKDLKGKIVEAKAHGDASAVKTLQDKIDALRGKKVTIEAELKKGDIGKIAIKVGKGGSMKLSAAAGGGLFGGQRSARIFRQADGVQFNEPDTRGEGYVPLANDWRRPGAIRTWRQIGREIGQFAGGGMVGGSGSGLGGVRDVHLHVTLPIGADIKQAAKELVRDVRSELISLNAREFGGRGLGF